jgi:LacI family transcriptional regulator
LEKQLPIDLKTLAAKLGVSITTVSRALAGYSDVSAATRARVVAAADAHGYRPNRIAQRLQSGRADAVGLVLPEGAGAYGDAFFAELIGAIGAALAENGLDLVLTVPRPREKGIDAIRRLADGGTVDGVIVPRTLWDDPRVDYLLARRFPFVTHGRTARHAEHAWHDVDGETAMRTVTRRLIDFGHRRLAFINAPLSYSFARHRLAGFEAALASAGIASAPEIVVSGPASTEAGHAAASAMLSAGVRPTAIICATDRIAYGAMQAAREAGLTVGRNVSIVGYDDLMASPHQQPPLTTMRQPLREEGAALVAKLLGVIRKQPLKQLQELVQATLVARASDGPPPDR